MKKYVLVTKTLVFIAFSDTVASVPVKLLQKILLFVVLHGYPHNVLHKNRRTYALEEQNQLHKRLYIKITF